MKKILLLLCVLLSSVGVYSQSIRYVDFDESTYIYGSNEADEVWQHIDSLVLSGANDLMLYQALVMAQFYDLTGVNFENYRFENDEFPSSVFFPIGINSGAKERTSNVISKWPYIKTEERYFRVNLKHVTFPNGLKSIGSYAFFWNNLIALDLPSSLVSIGNNAFVGCRYLKSVKLHIANPEKISLDGNPFREVPDDIVLYVPKGSKAAFEANESWGTIFKTIREYDDVSSVAGVKLSLAKSDGKIYTIDGRFVGTDFSKLPKGIYVLNGKKIIH